MVGAVYRDSAAQRAGIEEHDLLLSVDGKEIKGPDSFVDLMADRKPGDKVKLGLIHKGEKKSIEVVLDKRPAELPSMGFRPMLPEVGRMLHPEYGRRGRIIVQKPDGSKQSFQLPQGLWDFDDFMKQMEEQFPELWKMESRGDLSQRIQKLFDAMKEGNEGSAWSSTESESSVIRLVEGDYDVTITDKDGHRTVDVKKGDKVIAERLPYDQLKTLPDDVRQAVEKAAGSVKITPLKKIHKLEPSAGEKELKA